MQRISDLIAGYRRFYQQYFLEDVDVYRKLASQGQSPTIAIIACSDSRVDPSIITQSQPGQMFVIRNVANLVPPYQPDHHTHHGTSAALEFAVNGLQVKHVIVFGHSKCAGIHALMEQADKTGREPSFIDSWMHIAHKARHETEHEHAHLPQEDKAAMCSRKAIENSLSNLETFPWIAERVRQGILSIHGWYFDLDSGELWRFDPAKAAWQKL